VNGAVSAMSDAPVRSPMERQLSIGLMVVMVAAALLIAYAVAYVAAAWDGDGDRTRSAAMQVALVFLVLPGAVVFFTARSARRRLGIQVVSARLFGILTGIFAILAALPVITTIFGLVLVAAGLFTLTAAIMLKREHLQ
jgi:lysylphosphatidylglycerol synthetase-like protein (DUF2156 family)